MTHRLNVMDVPVKFHEYIPYDLGVMDRTRLTIYVTKSRGNNSKIKNARVLFLVHDTSSECDACTCKVSWIYSIRFRTYGPETKWDVRTDERTYGTDRGNTYCPSAVLRIGGDIKRTLENVIRT